VRVPDHAPHTPQPAKKACSDRQTRASQGLEVTNDHPRSLRILTAIIELARALALQTVAERIEDDDTWTEVAQIGFDLVQGSRLCPPLPADQVEHWLQHPSWFTAAKQP
jgi:EAL domain-containing protein (putative c-di-GMP-specific phosphodiesterase class I)